MLKKSFYTAALSLAILAGASAPASAQDASQNHEQSSVVVNQQITDIEIEETSAPNNSSDGSQVQQSTIAKKMTQAEKNENAKENDSFGGAITLIAMIIVVSVLIVLSLLFYGFGKISSALMSRKKRMAHGLSKKDLPDNHEHVDSGDVIAAIAMALSEHFSGEHDIEDTILTIRRMKKAYSPWNSKIYNMRPTPEVCHNNKSNITRERH
ncbi:MAG: OadG family protein [Muribaculum sp.]|nr:OadG family protein [Muribaculum sp.]